MNECSCTGQRRPWLQRRTVCEAGNPHLKLPWILHSLSFLKEQHEHDTLTSAYIHTTTNECEVCEHWNHSRSICLSLIHHNQLSQWGESGAELIWQTGCVWEACLKCLELHLVTHFTFSHTLIQFNSSFNSRIKSFTSQEIVFFLLYLTKFHLAVFFSTFSVLSDLVWH